MALSHLFKPLLLISAFYASNVCAVEILPSKDAAALMADAKKNDRVGTARKSREVDARPALAGEIVITFIKGIGVETRSRPAEEGDWVVRNRCEETGNEEILVKAQAFPDRYGEALTPPNSFGYQAFKPKANNVSYFTVTDDIGAFKLKTEDEPTVVLPGDVVVQFSSDENDTARVAAAAFECTYEIINPAKTIIDTALR